MEDLIVPIIIIFWSICNFLCHYEPTEKQKAEFERSFQKRMFPWREDSCDKKVRIEKEIISKSKKILNERNKKSFLRRF